MRDIGLEMKMKPWEWFEVKPHCFSAVVGLDCKTAAVDQ